MAAIHELPKIQPPVHEPPNTPLTTQEQQWVDHFMDTTTLFLGPDPAIMRDHSITRRTQFEEECIAKGIPALQVDRIRKRLEGALDEGYEMCEAMGAAPGAKWGDLTTAIYTASGDVTYLSCRGVIAFSAVAAPPDPVHHEVLEGRAHRGHPPG
jgi:acetone carboxylase alpha subunit